LVERLVTSGDHDDLGSGERVVGYGGSGETENGVVLWQARRAWDEILGADPGPLAAVFSALANPMRIRIVAALAERALTTRLLLEALEEPTTGQLFHHLRDLLAADLVFQPVRGTYAIRHQHVVPLLAGLSAALDLGHHSSTEPERP
jgi:DNA-binding transcriptional ArsR family regulator